MEDKLEELWNKLTLTEEEKDGIEIREEDENDFGEDEKLILVGKILTGRPFHANSFLNVMRNLWRPKRELQMKSIGPNLFLFKFNLMADVQKVIEGSPWHFDNSLVLLSDYEKRKQPTEIEMSKSLFWVRFYNLPLGYMTKGVAEKLGRKLGTIVEIDLGGEEKGWGRFLRVRVNMEINKPLRRAVPLSFKGIAEPKWIPIKYERLPLFCFYCGKLGHHIKDCSEEEAYEKDTGVKYGTWLRASPMKRIGRMQEDQWRSSTINPIYQVNKKQEVSNNVSVGSTKNNETKAESKEAAAMEESVAKDKFIFIEEREEGSGSNQDNETEIHKTQKRVTKRNLNKELEDMPVGENINAESMESSQKDNTKKSIGNQSAEKLGTKWKRLAREKRNEEGNNKEKSEKRKRTEQDTTEVVDMEVEASAKKVKMGTTNNVLISAEIGELQSRRQP